jgi:hypothetical protein
VESTAEPDWKSTEKIAALLEKALVPSAIVKHDEKLPVIGSPRRRPRQCDVVITYGEPPRQTVTIVEVQKRKRKPDIVMFHGWVQKMHEVGAQHLICVSALGYPQSIIDDVATNHGPTVRLMTMEELQQPEIPGLEFIDSYMPFNKPHGLQIEPMGPIETVPPSSSAFRMETTIKINLNDKLFELGDGSERLALTGLVEIVLRELLGVLYHTGGEDSFSIDMNLGTGKRDLWLCIGNERYKLRQFPVRVSGKNRVAKIPLTCFAYQQESTDGVLAWVASAEGTVEGKEVNIRLVFKPDKTGFLRLALMEQLGVGHLALVSSTDRLALTSFVAKRYPENI